MDVNIVSGHTFESSDILASFVLIIAPTSECRLCFPFDMTLRDRLPSRCITLLLRYYAVIRLPATRLPFSLLRLFGIPLIHYCPSADMEIAGSPLLTQWHCTTWLTLDPAVPKDKLTIKRLSSVLLSSSITLSAHWFCKISGLKCLPTLSPDCLRLVNTVTSANPRLAISGVVSTFLNGISTH